MTPLPAAADGVVGVVGVVWAVGIVGAVGIGAVAVPATAASGVPSSGTVVDRVVRDERISESSGLAASVRHPKVLWTHNDSGHPARLFAVGPDGRTVAVVRVSGVPAVDWEAIAAYRDRSGRAMLAVADIGDNRGDRASVSIIVLAEPALRNGTVRPERVIRLRYPTGAVDAEALLVDPDGQRAFLVTKGFSGVVWEVPPAVWTAAGEISGGTSTLIRRASAPLLFVTDAVMGPGGHPVLRTYSQLAVLSPIDDAVTDGSLHPLATVRLPRQAQGESLTLLDRRTALVGSEGTGQAVLRVPLPDDVRALFSRPSPSAPTPAPAGGPAASSPAPVSSPTGGSRGDGAGSRLLPVLGGVAGAVGGAALVLRSRARRRRHRHRP